VVVILIGVGAFLGRTKESAPSEAFLGSGASASPAQASAAPGGAAAPERELRVIKTYTRRDCTLAPWLIADKLGYFAEEGVKLAFTGDIHSLQRMPSVVSGDNDVSDAHPNTLAVAIAGGAKLKGVVRAGVEPSDELDPVFRHMWWFVNPEKYPDVHSFADLKKIEGPLKFSVLSTSSCNDFLANRILDANGIPRDRIEWVTMPDVQAIQALKQGSTDVGGVHPPFFKGMVDAGQRKIADSLDANLGPEVAGLGFYYFSEDFIKNNPEAVQGFVNAINRAQAWINENPEQARIWTEEAIGIPVSANHYYSTELVIKDEQIVPWLEDLEDQGVIPKGKIKPSDIAIHDFVDS
jgi:ABC-type nitrate/sulfonate/bicarbonate transport system substrate-binding protein